MSVDTAHNTEWIDDFFTKSGPKPVAMNDLRRHPRFYYRSCAEVVLYPIVGQKKPTRAFVLVWLAVMILLMLSVILGMIDLRLTLRLRRKTAAAPHGDKQ